MKRAILSGVVGALLAAGPWGPSMALAQGLPDVAAMVAEVVSPHGSPAPTDAVPSAAAPAADATRAAPDGNFLAAIEAALSRPQSDPVVVELFTSQGCSACPPADALLAELAERKDVIALALHVDYWDYLGWEDPFAQPAFTDRQKAYARAAGERAIYTPQMVVEGKNVVAGANAADLAALIETHRAATDPVRMSLRPEGGRYVIELLADPPLETGAVVQIVRYAPQARVEILRGENAGRIVDYANVVTAWHAVAEWDGRTPLKLTAAIDGDEPAVVIVQSARPGKAKAAPLPGEILAAARLN